MYRINNNNTCGRISIINQGKFTIDKNPYKIVNVNMYGINTIYFIGVFGDVKIINIKNKDHEFELRLNVFIVIKPTTKNQSKISINYETFYNLFIPVIRDMIYKYLNYNKVEHNKNCSLYFDFNSEYSSIDITDRPSRNIIEVKMGE